MPKRLDPAERAERDRIRELDRKLNIQAYWEDFRDDAEELVPTVPDTLAARKPLTASQVWLLIALAETGEHNHLVTFKGRSSQTRHFDDIAPRTHHGRNYNPWRRGVPGFTSRICGQIPEFVRHSRNGYVDLNQLGYAVVMHLRQTYRELSPDARLRRNLGELEVPNFVTLGNTTWRAWLETPRPAPALPGVAPSFLGLPG